MRIVVTPFREFHHGFGLLPLHFGCQYQEFFVSIAAGRTVLTGITSSAPRAGGRNDREANIRGVEPMGRQPMQFPQDGGLSCVRYYLDKRDPELEAEAFSLMVSRARHVGSMICQCKADRWWHVCPHPNQQFAVLACGCNGSSIPVYIGEPPFGPLSGHWAFEELPAAEIQPCACGGMFGDRLAIGIGYPESVPPLGSLDVERAQEVVIVGRCTKCGGTFLRWNLQLPEPPTINGDEPWIKVIQGFDFGPATRRA
jgi:hypothetical protein